MVSHARQTKQQRQFRAPGHQGTKRIADIGCGVGGPMRTIARFTGCQVVGVNNNPYQVSQANAMNARAGLSVRRRHDAGRKNKRADAAERSTCALPCAATLCDSRLATTSSTARTPSRPRATQRTRRSATRKSLASSSPAAALLAMSGSSPTSLTAPTPSTAKSNTRLKRAMVNPATFYYSHTAQALTHARARCSPARPRNHCASQTSPRARRL